MARDLLIGVLAVTAFISLGGHLQRGNPLATRREKLLLGGVTGILGVLLLFFGVPIRSGGLLDYSPIAVIIAAVYGANLAVALLATLLISVVRYVFFPAPAALLPGISLLLLTGLGAVVRRRCPNRRCQWFWLAGASVLLAAVPLYPAWEPECAPIFLLYAFFFLVALLIAYSLSEYIYESNTNYYQYKQMAEKDWLTGLDNVRRFDAAINRMVAYGERFALLFIDIDHFKRINDTYGHPAGDVVLRDLGGVLARACRSFDIISRYGGEEFAILLSGCTCAKALEVAERVRAGTAAHSFVLPDGRKLRITVSIGVAGYPNSARTAEELIRRADNELYAAKITGRNRVSGNCGQNE